MACRMLSTCDGEPAYGMLYGGVRREKGLTKRANRSTIASFRREIVEKANRMEQAGFRPVLPIGVIGSYAADVCEPRQVREEATVSGPLWVP